MNISIHLPITQFVCPSVQPPDMCVSSSVPSNVLNVGISLRQHHCHSQRCHRRHHHHHHLRNQFLRHQRIMLCCVDCVVLTLFGFNTVYIVYPQISNGVNNQTTSDHSGILYNLIRYCNCKHTT